MKEPSVLGNEKRAWWRIRCRQRLAEHIRETLGIQVAPTEVRLQEAEHMQYSWKVKEPSLNRLFKRHLSKHSVRAYMQLYHEVGKSFYATHREVTDPVELTPLCISMDENTSEPSEEDYIQQLIDENTRLTEDLEQVTKQAKSLEEAKVLAESNLKVQEIMLQEAQATINFHQQDAQQWMAVAETYQNSCIQCSSALSQLISFTEGIQSRVSVAFPESAPA
ncbi:hypothetical protein BDW72DRAFT_198246 [Aspergillus terricola var. indicus]